MPAQPNHDDAGLVRRCLEGDASAWRALVDRHTALVYSIPVRYGLAPEVRDDIFQSVFLLLLRNLASVRDHQSLAKWLIVTTRRECARAIAAASREGATGGARAAVGEAEPPLAELERLERRQRVWAALERLDPRCRELLTALFRAGDQPDYAAVAARLGIPMGSIGPSRARCLRRLLDQLGEQPLSGE